MNNYNVTVQWGGNTAPWNQDGVWVIGGRQNQNVVNVTIQSANGGQSFSGTIAYNGEGPLGFRATLTQGNSYTVEVQWGGNAAPWNQDGIWVIGGRSNQRAVQVNIASPDGGQNFNGTMAYAGEGPIGFKGGKQTNVAPTPTPTPNPTPTNYIDMVKQSVSNYFNYVSGPSYLRILDTPHVWGLPFGKEIMPQAKKRQAEFERAIVEIMQKARYRCDLSSLNSPDPDWVKAILGAMDTALTKRMGRTQPTQFRFFFGQTPMPANLIGEPTNFAAFKAALVRLVRVRSPYWERMPEIWMGRFYRFKSESIVEGITEILSALASKIFGGSAVESLDTKMTWNHSKIIAVDGTEALVGGHNLNMDLFTSYPPVHDVSVAVHGDAVLGSQQYLNQMWVCGNDLLIKETLNTANLTWENKENIAALPTDPLVATAAVTYMRASQQALVAMHQSGVQTGVDAPVSNPAVAPQGIRAQDLQTLADLQQDVFQERITYNTYENFSDYKLATRMLAVGKYWNGPNIATDYQKASELMKERLIKSAKKTIRMSQMDLISAWKKNWSDHVVSIWLLQALLANKNLRVQVVVSPLDAGAGAEGDQYSFGSGAVRTRELLKYYMTHDVATDALLNDQDGARAEALTRLEVAAFSYTTLVPADKRTEGQTYKWPNLSATGKTASLKQPSLAVRPPNKGDIGSAARSVINASGYIYAKVDSAPGNHAKIMIIDDELYVVGSDNLYPGNLSEFNYLVEGTTAVSELVANYWNPLWQSSIK